VPANHAAGKSVRQAVFATKVRKRDGVMRRAILTLAILVLAAGSAQAQLAVTDKAIIRKTTKLELDVHYPHTGRPDLDHIFSDFAKSYASEIKPNEPDPLNLIGDDPKGSNAGWMGYKVRRNDGQMLSIQIGTNTYQAGGAHGMPDMVSYNFLMPDGALVFLPELVDGQRGLNQITRLVIADLTK
jgi:hypothetical protein